MACVARATAEFPSFHGVSRKKLLAASDANAVQWWQLSPDIADLYALYRLDLEGAWIQSSLDRTSLSLGFRAARTRVEVGTCEFQSTT